MTTGEASDKGEDEPGDGAYWENVRAWFESLKRWESLGNPRERGRAEPRGEVEGESDYRE